MRYQPFVACRVHAVLGIRMSEEARPGPEDHFSESTSPRTNQRCIVSTTARGGSIASSVAVITRCHSVAVSPDAIMLRIPTTAVVSDCWLVIRIGHKYWFQP